MATISNVNNAYNVNTSKTHKKLSFELGEKISARIMNIDGETSEAILKLLDGWQFSAQIKDAIDFTPNKLIRFEVEGYDSGKILLKVLNEAEQKVEQSLVDILEEQGVNVKDEDYNILQKMIKYNMPLTKENISKMKTLLELQGKINISTHEENQFIERYLGNKNINLESQEGQNIKNILKGFFSEFKKLSTDEIFTLIQSNIELTEKNIKSFNNINKGCMHIYEDIICDDNLLQDFEEVVQSKDIQEGNNESNKENLNLTKNEEINNNSSKNTNIYNSKAYSNDKNVMDGKEILRRLLELDVESNNEEKQIIQDNNIKNNVVDNSQKENINLDNHKTQNITKNNEEKNIILNDNKIAEDINKEEVSLKDNIEKKIADNKINNNTLETSQKVKEELNNKINDMKQIIKHALGENNDGKSLNFDKVFQNLQAKMNDFKVFNSLSNQYYYLDVPVSVNEKEYPCKLIIKDDRKNGKQIDSTNVKFAVCVKTVNIGVVDAYINVINSNINVNIKCEENWVKLIKLTKDKIMNKLSDLGYIVGVNVDRKQQEMNLVECNTFFEDNDFSRINFKV
ncbi:hypothetical protein ADU80_02820 [Clostridium botulinum]|uniref:Flagellar hook-length control protein FliK n=1 Tax=Clostridium botulinum TaxID=1491 RepID=A0A9Q1V0Q3_CLOBO|nr:hypothetical protein [Clostridium botulinum]AEB75210.1 conserved protein [Clostridium botulinum BKT015925]KEI05409.1 hypothetical protein Y848_08960 [Clostridium botulinum C/D str. Sp77]KOA80696.1 hypothetical protein ADU77_00680 [Clostridium botulinum]KOA83434.1 hypothetical protein ADU75_10855 [Clostridium botulinum]KOA87229.1 hypothetical protein ADU80_02820 [Clostridium botulinum]